MVVGETRDERTSGFGRVGWDFPSFEHLCRRGNLTIVRAGYFCAAVIKWDEMVADNMDLKMTAAYFVPVIPEDWYCVFVYAD